MSDPSSNGAAPADEPTDFSDGFRADARKLVLRYPVARSALLPLLHLVQSEHGYVTDAGIRFCAEALDLTKAEVAAVATFYTMYKRSPVGDYLLSVCTNPTCQVAGAQVIFERYKEALGGAVHDPETGVSIEEAECLGICDAAPVVQVNYDMYGPVTDEEADRLLEGCRSGSPPASTWSGEPAPTFREVERELSGANDAFGDHLVAAAHHAIVANEQAPAYKSGMTDLPVTHPGGDRAGHGGAIFAAEFAGGAAADVAPEQPRTVTPSEPRAFIEQPDGDDGLSDEQAERADDVADETANTTASPESAAIADDASEAADTGGDAPDGEPGTQPTAEPEQPRAGEADDDGEG